MTSSRYFSISLLFSLFVAGSFSCRQAFADQAQFDGPAELPRKHVKSSLADTPASGKVREVREGENLQATLEAANCGDTIKLQAGATFHGQFHFSEKPCDDGHWIVVRTSTADSELPPEGTRLTPCFAGIASLPGR